MEELTITGKYLGSVTVKDGYTPYFFFTPLAKIIETEDKSSEIEILIEILSEDARYKLLSSSKLKLGYYIGDYTSEEQRMRECFSDNTLIVIEFQKELKVSRNTWWETCATTSFQLERAWQHYEKEKIRQLQETDCWEPFCKNFIQIIPLDKKYLCNNEIVQINAPNLSVDERVFIELDDIWAGPYDVKQDNDNSFFIEPRLKEHKYVIHGYKKDSDSSYILDASTFKYRRDTMLEAYQTDGINDDALLDSFRNSLENSLVDDGKIPIEDLPRLVQQWEDSLLSGRDIPKEIIENRCERLKQIANCATESDIPLTHWLDHDSKLLEKLFSHSSVIKVVEREAKKRSAQLQKQMEMDEKRLQAKIDNATHFFSCQLRIYAKQNDKIAELRKEETLLQDEISNLKESIASQMEHSAKLTGEISEQSVEKKRLYNQVRNLKKTMTAQTKCSQKLTQKMKRRSLINEELKHRNAELERQMDEAKENYERTKKEWEQAIQKVTDEFNTALESPEKMMAKTAIDGYRASKVLQAAAAWEKEDSTGYYENLIKDTKQIAEKDTTEKIKKQLQERKKLSDKATSEEVLCEYLCDTVQLVRPSYTRNTILNIAICITQGFLTVFSGEPGCGKTSICNIFGDVLGLNKIGEEIKTAWEEKYHTDIKPNRRYISVSVERGWTSKRDFVGYYNPLSKSFNTNNQDVYDALRLLDKEKATSKSNFPYLILLDEANLSPMEYYWSDFMNICDDLNEQSQVNFGDEYIFSIPETLHFVATINNDDTTERLSPRLIDRAWIVSLPEYDAMSEQKSSADFKENIQIIPWSSLRNAFFVEDEENDFIPVERNFFADDTKNKEISTDQLTKVKTAYKDILDKLKKLGITVNARTNQAIRKYWAVASRCFADDTFKNKAYKEKNNEDTKVDKTIVALDYAVMQKLLPKISGNGPDFKGALENLRDTCSSYGLKESTKIIKGILSGGNYDYYNFFHRGVYQEDEE